MHLFLCVYSPPSISFSLSLPPPLSPSLSLCFQSCSSSLSLSSLLEKCLPLPEKCQLSTLLQQHHVLPHHLPSSTATLKTLQQNYEVSQREKALLEKFSFSILMDLLCVLFSLGGDYQSVNNTWTYSNHFIATQDSLYCNTHQTGELQRSI